MKSEYHKWTTFPPPHNTNDIIRDEYYGVLEGPFTPPPNLVLTSICYNPHEETAGGGVDTDGRNFIVFEFNRYTASDLKLNFYQEGFLWYTE